MAGIDYIQLREKDLSGRELEVLSREAVQLIRETRRSARLLINSRTDIALAADAHGVHMTSNDIPPMEVKKIWHDARASKPVIAVSCHSEADVIAAEIAPARVAAGVHARPADFVVFGPVFEKHSTTPAGLDQLQKVCRHRIPVFALGGVNTENAHVCIEAGASGIAGIRLFQENDVAAVVTKLRAVK